MNVSQLQDDILMRLGEAQDSLVAAYLSGTNSNTPVFTSQQACVTIINDGQNDLARNYYPLSDVATYTWPAGQQFTKYSQFVCQANALNQVFGIRKLQVGGFNLTSAGRAATENWYPEMDTDVQSQPRFFYEDGIDGVGVYPIPAANMAASAKAIVIPAPLVLETDVPQFPVDRHILLSWWTCAQVLLYNTEDPALASRGMNYMQAYRNGAMASLDRMWRLDPDFANDLLAARPGQQMPEASPQSRA